MTARMVVPGPDSWTISTNHESVFRGNKMGDKVTFTVAYRMSARRHEMLSLTIKADIFVKQTMRNVLSAGGFLVPASMMPKWRPAYKSELGPNFPAEEPRPWICVLEVTSVDTTKGVRGGQAHRRAG